MSSSGELGAKLWDVKTSENCEIAISTKKWVWLWFWSCLIVFWIGFCLFFSVFFRFQVAFQLISRISKIKFISSDSTLYYCICDTVFECGLVRCSHYTPCLFFSCVCRYCIFIWRLYSWKFYAMSVQTTWERSISNQRKRSNLQPCVLVQILRFWSCKKKKSEIHWNSRVDSDDRGMVVYNSCTNSVPGVCNCFPLFWSLLYLCICDVKHSQMGGTPAARAGKRKNLYQLVLIDCSYSRKKHDFPICFIWKRLKKAVYGDFSYFAKKCQF